MPLPEAALGMVRLVAMGMVSWNMDAERHVQLCSLAVDLIMSGPLCRGSKTEPQKHQQQTDMSSLVAPRGASGR
jgi:hypothetical protein